MDDSPNRLVLFLILSAIACFLAFFASQEGNDEQRAVEQIQGQLREHGWQQPPPLDDQTEILDDEAGEDAP